MAEAEPEEFVATEEDWSNMASDAAAEDWGEEEEAKEEEVSSARRAHLSGPLSEEFQGLLATVESFVASLTVEQETARHLAVHDADPIFQRTADWIVATKHADNTGLSDAELMAQVFDVIDRDTPGEVTKRPLYVRLMTAYFRTITIENPARAGPTILTLMKRIIQADMNPPGRAGIIQFMPLRFYSAQRLADFVDMLWAGITDVFRYNVAMQSYLETTALISAYHASLRVFGKEGEQRFLDKLSAGYRTESGLVSPELFQRRHPGPYRWLTKCQSRLRRCSNLVTSQHLLPLCDVPSPVFWGPIPTDKHCYDLRQLVPVLGQQLAVAPSVAPVYPIDKSTIPSGGLRVLRRRASVYGVPIPAGLDTFIATLPLPKRRV